jgi:hypothetical protein
MAGRGERPGAAGLPGSISISIRIRRRTGNSGIIPVSGDRIKRFAIVGRSHYSAKITGDREKFQLPVAGLWGKPAAEMPVDS